MKKLIAIILTLCVVLSLAACSGGNADTASTNSPDAGNNAPTTSSKPKPLGSEVTNSSEDGSGDAGASEQELDIEYKSIAKGYINHSNIYNASIVKFDGFECMENEYIFIPKGTTIISEQTCAIFCYKVEEGQPVLDINDCKATGCVISPSGWSLQHSAGTYQTTTDVYARISVKGSLKNDVQIFPQKDKIEEVKLLTEEEFIAAHSN